MTDIKYTGDGKKVLVVGKLNAIQTIVQEIFVSAGQEIPSGERIENLKKELAGLEANAPVKKKAAK